MKPITPAEAKKKKHEAIPNEVIEVFNNLIEEKFNGEDAKVLQDDVILGILEKLNVDREEIFAKHWLDVETIFEEAGWQVKYDGPAFNESYAAYFVFTYPNTKCE